MTINLQKVKFLAAVLVVTFLTVLFKTKEKESIASIIMISFFAYVWLKDKRRFYNLITFLPLIVLLSPIYSDAYHLIERPAEVNIFIQSIKWENISTVNEHQLNAVMYFSEKYVTIREYLTVLDYGNMSQTAIEKFDQEKSLEKPWAVSGLFRDCSECVQYNIILENSDRKVRDLEIRIKTHLDITSEIITLHTETYRVTQGGGYFGETIVIPLKEFYKDPVQLIFNATKLDQFQVECKSKEKIKCNVYYPKMRIYQIPENRIIPRFYQDVPLYVPIEFYNQTEERGSACYLFMGFDGYKSELGISGDLFWSLCPEVPK